MKKIIILLIGLYFHIGVFAQKEPNFKTVLKAAKQGDVNGQLLAGIYYYNGKGVAQDYQQAAYWYEKAAEQNNAFAQGQIGLLYDLGIGVAKDTGKAVYWFKKAAEQGDAGAQSNLGNAYEEGKGVAQDYSQAVYWYKGAAEKENGFGLSNLANCYAKGHGVSQDYKQAEYWYRKAIDKNNPYAYLGLATLYAQGAGVTKNSTIALNLMKQFEDLAAKGGYILNEAAVLRDKGEIYYYLEDMSKAKEMWMKLQQDHPFEVGRFLSQDDEVFVHSMQKMESTLDFEIPETEETVVQEIIESVVDQDIPDSKQKETNVFAFIMGNEAYRRVEPVPFAKNDGKVFAEYCKKTMGIPEKNVHLLLDATLGDLKYQVSQMKQIAEAFDGEAKFIFYYAGHGLPAENQQDAFLLPVDGYGADGTGYSVNELYNELGALNAKSVVVLLDACFSGAKRDGGMIASARGVAIKAKQAAPKGNMVIISAAQGDETAHPYKEQGHGLFTYFLLKKLNESKGNVTLGELADYITSGVKKTSIVENGKLQTPSVNASPNLANTWRSMNLK